MTGLVSVSTRISLINEIIVFIPSVQFCPPLAGAGLSHVLFLVSVCCSVGLLQGLHSDHSANKDRGIIKCAQEINKSVLMNFLTVLNGFIICAYQLIN